MDNSTINVVGVGTPLQTVLLTDSIVPGSEPGYQACKTLYLYHPLGKKMTEGPINIAQSQRRKITINSAPEDDVREAFEQEWNKLQADETIAQLATTSRIYGVGAWAFNIKGKPTDRAFTPEELKNLYQEEVYFNVLDPLNTSGSMITNQDPNAPDFQKTVVVTASSKPYDRSLTCVLMNERPVYIAYTNSAFGYVGRSVFQRALFPMKTFVQSMITDDMITFKAGLLVAKLKQAVSIVDNVMRKASQFKRNLLKEGRTGQVLSIGTDEEIETLDMNNTDVATKTSRMNVLENIAAAADMPAQMLNSETFAEGFGEGTEDAKTVVRYIEHIRKWMYPAYCFMDRIVQYRAWNPEFIQRMREKYGKEYGYADKSDDAIFMSWVNSFNAVWPSLMIEPESEQAKAEKVKLDLILALLGSLAGMLDPMNKANMVQWAVDNINENTAMFRHALDLNVTELLGFLQEQQTRMQTLQDTTEQDDEDKEQSGANAPAVRMKVA